MKKLPLLGVVFLLTACAGAVPSQVRQYREGPSGLREGESVSAVLLRYRSPKTDAGDASEILSDKAKFFESCVGEGLAAAGVAVSPSSTLPPALTQALPAEETSPADAVLQRLRNRGGAGAWTGPRFLVVLEAETKESEPRGITYVDGSGEAFGLVVGETRVRTTDLRAYVFDPAAPRYLGRVESTSWGYVGWEMPILYCILPCCPIPHSARTEVRACKDLGADLAEFLRRGAPATPQGEGR